MFQEFKDRSKQHWENQRRFRGGHGLRQAGKKGEKIPGRSSYLKESAEEGKSLSTQWGGCAPNPPCPAQGEVEQTHRGHRGGGCQSNGAVPGNLWDPSCQAAGQPLAVGRKEGRRAWCEYSGKQRWLLGREPPISEKKPGWEGHCSWERSP